MPGIAGAEPLMWVAWTSGRALRAGEDLAIAALSVQTGAAIRHAQLFHPTGVLANGTIARIAATGEGLPMVSGELVGRVSKGVGAPGALPDIAGVACPMPPPLPASTPWECCRRRPPAGGGRYPAAAADILVGSDILQPGAGIPGRVWWLRRLATIIDGPGLSLDTITGQIGSGGPDFDIEQDAGTGDVRLLARLSLREVVPPGRDLALTRRCTARQVSRVLPGWLTDFRRAAYRRSPQGRDAEYPISPAAQQRHRQW
jgi:hypothetical protein